jgi:hypothetical protein
VPPRAYGQKQTASPPTARTPVLWHALRAHRSSALQAGPARKAEPPQPRVSALPELPALCGRHVHRVSPVAQTAAAPWTVTPAGRLGFAALMLRVRREQRVRHGNR